MVTNNELLLKGVVGNSMSQRSLGNQQTANPNKKRNRQPNKQTVNTKRVWIVIVLTSLSDSSPAALPCRWILSVSVRYLSRGIRQNVSGWRQTRFRSVRHPPSRTMHPHWGVRDDNLTQRKWTPTKSRKLSALHFDVTVHFHALEGNLELLRVEKSQRHLDIDGRDLGVPRPVRDPA